MGINLSYSHQDEGNCKGDPGQQVQGACCQQTFAENRMKFVVVHLLMILSIRGTSRVEGGNSTSEIISIKAGEGERSEGDDRSINQSGKTGETRHDTPG